MYTKQDLVEALRKSGVSKGDILFSHSNIGFWGIPQGVSNQAEMCALVKEAIFEVIGESGTLCVPSFTYSFGSDKKEKEFNLLESKTSMGIFAEYIRKLPESSRSCDPMFSVSAIGKNSQKLLEGEVTECFGKNSFWDRFYRLGGKICNFNFDSGSTFIHYVEKMLSVPYRKDLNFKGLIVKEDGKRSVSEVKFFCRNLDEEGTQAKFERFDKIAKEKCSKVVDIGRGQILVISAEETFALIQEALINEPYFLTMKGNE